MLVWNPPKTIRPKGKVWWPKDWEHVSGSIPGTEVSPITQDTDVALDIGRLNHAKARLAPASRIEPEPVGNGW